MVHFTIRVRIIFWFVLIVASILCVFSTLVYFNFRTALLEENDNLLELKAEGIVDYIDAYWTAQKRKGLERGESPEAFLKVNSINFVTIAKRWVEEVPVDPPLADIATSIFSVGGKLLAASDTASAKVALSKKELSDILKGKSFFSDRGTRSAEKQKSSLRILTIPVIENNAIICALQLAKPLTMVEETLEKLRIKLLVFMPLSLLPVVFTGWMLANVILHPLTTIIHAVRHISAEKLSSRVKAPVIKDEIHRLAETFNDMLDKLEKSFVAQKQITEDVSHELRTPLTILKGEMEVALNKARSPEEYRAVLQSGLEEINKIQRMVENILLLARFESRQATLEFRELALGGFMEKICDDMRLLAASKQMSLTLQVNQDAIIRADEMHLRRAIVNVLDNAIKYTREGGSVTVNLEGKEGSAIVRVADTGIGIDAQRLPFIFNRFYRADTSRSSKGFGLGLSIAKAVIESHNGTIEVSSVLHQGTTVTIFIPLHH